MKTTIDNLVRSREPRSLRRIGALPLSLLTLSALCAAASCAAGSDRSSSSSGGGEDGQGGATVATTSSTSGSGDGGGLFDGGLGDGSQSTSCQYVDLLFVIDNSPSMGQYQDSLAAAFPSFVDAMYQKLPPAVDLHVGITTTSFFEGSCSESVSNCVTKATAADIAAHYTKPSDGNTGENGGQGRLFSYSGKSYYAANTSDVDQSGLKTWFAGAAIAAGETGCSFEMSSAGAAYAADPANQAANAGFFRDKDGVLLVVVLSDEPDKSPEGTAAYKNMLTSVKTDCGGDACILMAGLINPCVKDVNNSIWEFLNAFGEPPIWGDLSDPAQYTAVVGDALAQVVKQTCDDIAVPK